MFAGDGTEMFVGVSFGALEIAVKVGVGKAEVPTAPVGGGIAIVGVGTVTWTGETMGAFFSLVASGVLLGGCGPQPPNNNSQISMIRVSSTLQAAPWPFLMFNFIL